MQEINEHRFMPVRTDSSYISSSKPTFRSTVTKNSRVVPPATKSRGEAFWEFWNHYWLYELGSCLLSLVFFIAIIIILKMFENRRLPDWPLGITVNTVISILATALGSTLSVPISEGLGQLKWLWFRKPRMIADIETFDAATRGPLGAIQMFYRLWGLHMGNVGSFIMIIALALSPFIQQVIQYQTQSTVLSFNATIPTSNLFALNGGGYHLAPVPNSITQAAVFSGIFNSDTSALQVKPNCFTGNCTYSEPYSSLAVCSACSNVTKFIEVTPNKLTPGGTYSLPNGLSISDFGGEWINTTGSTDGSNTVWSGFGAPISVISIISSTNDAINLPGLGLIEGPWAAECVLYFCVNTYNATVDQGILSEQIISTYSNESAVLQGSESGPNGTSGYVLTPDPCLADVEPGKNSTYNAEGGIFSTCNYFVQPLTCFLPLNRWLSGVFLSGGVLDFEGVIYNNNTSINENTSNFTWVETVMDRVALSLTTHVRTYGLGNPTFGSSSAQETYVIVQWSWLILPAFIVSFSILFFLLTILQSRGMEAWKSSSLALMFASNVKTEQDEVGKLTEIEWLAEGRAAILKRTPEGNITLTKDID